MALNHGVFAAQNDELKIALTVVVGAVQVLPTKR